MRDKVALRANIVVCVYLSKIISVEYKLDRNFVYIIIAFKFLEQNKGHGRESLYLRTRSSNRRFFVKLCGDGVCSANYAEASSDALYPLPHKEPRGVCN